MVQLLHEIWTEPDAEGRLLESCCLAGPDGDDFRRQLSPEAKLVHTFTAGSHFEAMTIYNRRLGRGPYTTEHAQDFEPYPDEWQVRQQRADPLYWTFTEWEKETIEKIVVMGLSVPEPKRPDYLRVQIHAAIRQALRHGRSGRADDDPVTP